VVFLCEQGPFVHIVRMTATLRSSPLLLLHLDDQVSPQSCAERGFPTMVPRLGRPDHCYPPSELWFSNASALGLCGPYESGLIAGFAGYAQQQGLQEAVLNNNAACNCLPGTEVAAACPKLPGGQPLAAASPVRDWWHGQEWPGYLQPWQSARP